jgi:hypothetical protein
MDSDSEILLGEVLDTLEDSDPEVHKILDKIILEWNEMQIKKENKNKKCLIANKRYSQTDKGKARRNEAQKRYYRKKKEENKLSN